MTIITGTALDDLLRGSLTDDIIEGLDGNDSLQGGAGRNILRGGNGDDALWSFSIDHADGGAGIDKFFIIRGDSTATFIIDLSVSNSSADIGDGTSFAGIERLGVDGGTGNDKLTGGVYEDSLFGLGGNDTLSGGDGDDRLGGGDGNDIISGGNGNDKLDGWLGNDTISGGDGDDTIGYEFPFTIDDVGSDIIDGGAGTDYLIFNRRGSSTSVAINITAGGGGTNIGDGSAISGIEKIWFLGGTGTNTVTGGVLDDGLIGNTGNDTFNGGGGNDYLDGGFGGINRLNGGAGDDFIVAYESKALVNGGTDYDSLFLYRSNSTVNLTVDISAGGTGLDIGDGSTILGIEQIDARGGSGNDKLTGGAFTDNLFGGSGTNTLIAGGGDDKIYSGSGQFGEVIPGAVDIVNGGIGTDFLDLNRSFYIGNLTLDITAGGGGANIGDGSRISNIEQLVFAGGHGNDRITGGNLDDVIDGGDGANTLNGGGGDDKIVSRSPAVDSIDGGAGNDHLELIRDNFAGVLTIDLSAGGAGADIGDGTKLTSIESIEVEGGSGADIIIGGAGDDKIDGQNGLDTLNGGAGNDQITCGRGDIVDGGAGDDLVEVSTQLGFDVTIDLSAGGGGVDIGNGTKLSNVEQLIFVGYDGNYTITGGAGDDIVEVFQFKHALDGGGGEDSVYLHYELLATALTIDLSSGGGGIDIGNGTKLSNFEHLSVTGGDGNDKFTGGALDDYLNGRRGNDTLNGGAGGNNVYGEEGNDIIISLDVQGKDYLDGGSSFGGPEVDTLVLNRASQTKSLTIDLSGNAYVFLSDIGDGTKIFNFERINLVSGSGGDLITGGTGNDVIDGRAGNDTVYGSAGIDNLKGGAGTADVLIYTGNLTYTPVGLVIDLVAGKATTSLVNDTDTFSGFEAYYGSTGNDTLIGDAFANELYGGDGDDIVRGGAGADTLSGGNGLNDVLSYEGSTFGVFVDLALSIAIYGDASGDTISGFESITGGAAYDILFGDSKNNTLNGGAGPDSMFGGAGDDTYVVDYYFESPTEEVGEGTDLVLSSVNRGLSLNIENLELTGSANLQGRGNNLDNTITGNAGSNLLDGLEGADKMSGKLGNDYYFVDNAGDVVIESVNEGSDTVRSSVSLALAANIERLYLLAGAADGAGNSLSNFIYGNASANKLDGGTGADRLYGEEGNDAYTVDSAGDLVFETIAGAPGGFDTVNSSVNHKLSANVENLNLTGAANVNGAGNGEINAIAGNAGNNFIDGGLANDTLTGGLGLDNFVFTTTLGATNVDTVTDFSVANDTVRLDNAVFASLATGYLAAGAFHTGASAADASDRIIYNAATGDLFYDADGTGAAAQVRFAILGTGLAMTNADFYVF
ncbi:MAG: beta strand repeat-containing protein [Aestuariivirga sp.]